MSRFSRIASATILACCCSIAGCVLPPPAPPLESDVSEMRLHDEMHLLKQGLEAQHRFDRSGLLLRDAKLVAYLEEVARTLVGQQLSERGIEPRIRVLTDIDLNAFSFLNGVLYVHTSLLALMENEAQLATMISREYAHVIRQHTLIDHREKRATATLLATAGLAGSMSQAGSAANLLLKAGSASSMAGFSHLREVEADRLGLEMMNAAGYDLNEAPRFFEITIEYLNELARQRRPSKLAFALSAPLRVQARIKGYRDLLTNEYAAAANASGRHTNETRFRQMTIKARTRHAELELDAGLFQSAEATIRQVLSDAPRNSAAWVVLGEALERADGVHVNSQSSIDAYERAINFKPNHVRAHRALGLLFYRRARSNDIEDNNAERALYYFRRYLRIAPAAVDSGYIERYIEELEAGADLASKARSTK